VADDTRTQANEALAPEQPGANEPKRGRLTRRATILGLGTAVTAAAVSLGSYAFSFGSKSLNLPALGAPLASASPTVVGAAVAAPITPGAATAAPATPTVVPTAAVAAAATASPAVGDDAEAGAGSNPSVQPPVVSISDGAPPLGIVASGPPPAPLPNVGEAFVSSPLVHAEWIPSPNHRPRRQTINTLVMHTTAGSLQATLDTFENPTSRVSAHYVVARTGRVIQMVSENQVAYHAGVVSVGPDSRFYHTNPNQYSIGIEMENPYVIQSAADFPAAQKAAAFALAKDIVRRNNIPIDREHIVGHSEIDPAQRLDPGPGFPWDAFIAYIKGA
jgi:hypothetical protein